MDYRFLSTAEIQAITHFLGLPIQAPTLRYLNRLIAAYVRRVPWESVSRIVKRHTTTSTADCPRWPAEFWRDARQRGLGGTCFESSLAFYTLLLGLGYQGYLTVNDMGESRACHAAITILLGERKYLVDVTIPLQAAVRFSPGKTTRRRTAWQRYTIRHLGEDRYQVERSHHPNRIAFTLIDVPVSLSDFQAIVTRDYSPAGHFLDSVVINKVFDGGIWRFFSHHQPHRLEYFGRARKAEIPLLPQDRARALAQRFDMPEDSIAQALRYVDHHRAVLAQP